MPFKPQKILACTDFSPGAQLAADAAADLASIYKGEVTLLHVVPLSAYVDLAGALSANQVFDQDLRGRIGDKVATDLASEAKRLNARGVATSTLTVDGPAPLEIARIARERGVDLVVVGSHGRTGLKRALMGSVAEAVVRHSATAVLIIRGSS